MLLSVGNIEGNEQPSSVPESGKASESLAQAEELLYRNPQAMLALLTAAVNAEGPRSDLLWPIAQAQFALHDHDRALATLEQATQLEPIPELAIRNRISMLSKAGLIRHALAVIDAVPTELRDDPAVYMTIRSFYNDWNFFASAVTLGQPWPPPHFTASFDRAIWYIARALLRCSPDLRRWAVKLEDDKLLSPARQEWPHLTLLGQASGLTGSALTSLRASMDIAQVRLRFRMAEWDVVSDWIWRMRAGVVLAVWPVLWLAATRLPRVDRPTALALPTLASAAVAVCIALLVSRQIRGTAFWANLTWRGDLVRVGVLLAAGAGTADAYLHRLAPPADWQFWTDYGLIAAPAATAFMSVIVGAIESRMYRAWRATMRHTAHFEIIDDLLWLLNDLGKPGLHDAQTRLSHARLVDLTAAKVEEYLLPTKRRTVLSAEVWLNERAKGWAEALRQLERALVAENYGQSEKTKRFLYQEIRCLATGRLGSLAWKAPQTAPKKPLREQVLPAARNLLVALLPLGAVLTAHLLVHFAAGLFTGALLTTGAWAALTLMNQLDPDLDKKLTSAQQLTSMVRQPPRIGDGDSPHGAAPS